MSASPSAAPSLAVRTAKGAGWIIVWRMSTRLMGIVSTVVLVRLLAPADFGLVALATSFSQAVDWLSVIGAREALIREETLDRPLYDTAFTLNAMRGAMMASVILAGAWPIAAFFDDVRLAHILAVLAGTTLLASVENIGTVDFRRDLQFEKEFQLAVMPRIASITAAIASAVILRSYWCLIIGIVTNTTLRLVMSYLMSRYRPRVSLAAWRRIIGFSFWTWTCAVTMMLRDRIDTFAIGRVFGAATVGIYAVGSEIGSLASSELVEPLTAALFPGFAEARRTGASSSDGFIRSLSVTFMLTLPLGAGLSSLAAPLVRLAFGEQWMAAVPIVQILAIAGMVKVIAYISGVLLNAHGMIHIQFRVLAVSLVVRIVVLFALIGSLGLLGAAVAASASIVVEEVVFLAVTFRHFKLSIRRLLRMMWRSIAATIVMAGVLWLCGLGWAPLATEAPLSLAAVLAGGTLLGAAVYGGVLLLAWRAGGCPAGPERTLLDVLRQVAGRRLRAAFSGH
jgi:lipopolysaccharide exporter